MIDDSHRPGIDADKPVAGPSQTSRARRGVLAADATVSVIAVLDKDGLVTGVDCKP